MPTESLTMTNPAPAITEAAIAALDAGDALISLLDRMEGLVSISGNRVLAENLVVSILQNAEDWRTASRQLLTSLIQLLTSLIDATEEPPL